MNVPWEIWIVNLKIEFFAKNRIIHAFLSSWRNAERRGREPARNNVPGSPPNLAEKPTVCLNGWVLWQ
jgi:hypothetical protein